MSAFRLAVLSHQGDAYLPADPLSLTSECLHDCPELRQLVKEREDAWLLVASALIQRRAVDEEQDGHLGTMSTIT